MSRRHLTDPACAEAVKSFAVHKISMAEIERAVRALGGVAEEPSGTHNFLRYRMPNGKIMDLQASMANSRQIVHSGHVSDVLASAFFAEIPLTLLLALTDNIRWKKPSEEVETLRIFIRENRARLRLTVHEDWDEIVRRGTERLRSKAADAAESAVAGSAIGRMKNVADEVVEMRERNARQQMIQDAERGHGAATFKKPAGRKVTVDMSQVKSTPLEQDPQEVIEEHMSRSASALMRICRATGIFPVTKGFEVIMLETLEEIADELERRGEK